MDWTEFGQRIRRRRLALDLSQDEVAARAGLTPVTVSRVENGQSAKARTLWKLDRGLGWRPGSAEDVLHGGEPVELDGGKPTDPEAALRRALVEAGWSDDEIAAGLAAVRRDRRESGT